MRIKVTELKALTKNALKNYGYSDSEIEVIADILLYAQLRGNNQGVVKLIGAGIPKNQDGKDPTTIKETPVSALLNGNGTHAMIVMNLATDTAIEKAQKTGVGIVGNFGSSESTGALGYYVKKVADAGLIGIAYASAPFQTTAPHGSTEALFCTNPMAYGMPTKNAPVILDMSTSAIAYYGLIEAKTSGRTVGEGVGYDEDGNPTQHPAEIMAGAIKTFGGHKGSGLALVVQILAGALVQADSFNNDSDNAGNLVMAINPEILTARDDFTARVSSITQRIKSAKKAEGVDEIRLPGERAQAYYAEAMKSGEIEIDKNLLAELRKVAGR